MHILTDASSLVMSYELVNGIQKPSALNLFELARFVEGIIIHDKITVLDTSPNNAAEEQQIAIACDAIPSEFLSVEKATTYDIVTRYVDRTCPGFSRAL